MPTVPHDLVHFVVEEQAELSLGIYGQVAAGGEVGGFFRPDPGDRHKAADQRRSRRLGSAGGADVGMSERLAALVDERGRVRGPLPEELDPASASASRPGSTRCSSSGGTPRRVSSSC